ncbi:MAG TPA: protease HtpX, partial [Vicinamibacteria bacterium]|nr:protease HtpX [Vicinamibacteria bacterium]
MNTLKSTLLLGTMTGLLLATGYFFAGEQGAVLGLIFAGVMNFGAYFWSDKLVLASYQARAVTPEEAPQLYAAVQRLSQKAGIPMPKLY